MATLDVLCSLTVFSREAETVQPEVVSPQGSDQVGGVIVLVTAEAGSNDTF